MLLDEEPSALIHECIANFTLAPDKAALTRISETLSFLNEARQLRLNGLTNDLHRLERKHKALQQQHELEVQKYSPQEHAEKILEMDGKKFRVAKEASEAEIEGERLELEVERCEKSLGELKKRAAAGMNGGVAGQANVGKTAGQAVLKLKLYRSLGIDLEADAQGQINKAIVRNTQKGLVDVVAIDPTLPRTVYADRLWNAL